MKSLDIGYISIKKVKGIKLKFSEPFLLTEVYQVLPFRICCQGLCVPNNPHSVLRSRDGHVQTLPFSQETDTCMTIRGGVSKGIVKAALWYCCLQAADFYCIQCQSNAVRCGVQ
jgi:hypothetical protein